MRVMQSGLLVVVVVAALATSARLSLRAQDSKGPDEPKVVTKPADTGLEASRSVLDALERDFDLPFGDPTPLEEVCRYLRRSLNAPVVLDLAALARQHVQKNDSVELELKGVRLKTGLKLLLDQVGLTYRVVPEDNLLILTDNQGADDPLKRIQAEVHELHLEIHDVQDALNEVHAALGLGEGVKIQKPTIIEEMPDGTIEEKAAPPPATTRPRRGI
ncbi:hypothetical protein [Singulisphaera acidiphila]|uniref:Uncharacterized protein n=1 Tax=Singulisphaera acidiphila (strain ATCC BAA-1392 / DSM 18658 / VKM B-2454 / MOB10) TaxID=886293 RepID=L0DC25_SINAD|nr:hypothetical protein [Singulisphaera acidiphila]AGA26924.1 hypothetical protein Sinac_2622 [Singulisphaera acidiphila DSM 18658]